MDKVSLVPKLNLQIKQTLHKYGIEILFSYHAPLFRTSLSYLGKLVKWPACTVQIITSVIGMIMFTMLKCVEIFFFFPNLHSCSILRETSSLDSIGLILVATKGHARNLISVFQSLRTCDLISLFFFCMCILISNSILLRNMHTTQ